MSDSRDRDQRSSPTGGGRRRSRSPERAGGRRGSSSGGGGQDDRDSRDRVDINRDRRRSPDRDDRRGGGYNGNNHGNVGGGRGDNRDSRYETFVHKSHRTVPGTGGPPDNYSNVILFIRNIDAKLTRRELHHVLDQYGEVKTLSFHESKGAGMQHRYLLCEYVSPDDAKKAHKALHDSQKLGNRRLQVRFAVKGRNPPQCSSPKPSQSRTRTRPRSRSRSRSRSRGSASASASASASGNNRGSEAEDQEMDPVKADAAFVLDGLLDGMSMEPVKAPPTLTCSSSNDSKGKGDGGGGSASTPARARVTTVTAGVVGTPTRTLASGRVIGGDPVAEQPVAHAEDDAEDDGKAAAKKKERGKEKDNEQEMEDDAASAAGLSEPQTTDDGTRAVRNTRMIMSGFKRMTENAYNIEKSVKQEAQQWGKVYEVKAVGTKAEYKIVIWYFSAKEAQVALHRLPKKSYCGKIVSVAWEADLSQPKASAREEGEAGKIHDKLKDTMRAGGASGVASVPNNVNEAEHTNDDFEAALLLSTETAIKKRQGPPSRTLFVGNLAKDCTKDDLNNYYKVYGPLDLCKVCTATHKPGSHATYGFVQFKLIEDAIKARRLTWGQELKGRVPQLGFGKAIKHKQVLVGGFAKKVEFPRFKKWAEAVSNGRVLLVESVKSAVPAVMIHFETSDHAQKFYESQKWTVVTLNEIVARPVRLVYWDASDGMRPEAVVPPPPVGDLRARDRRDSERGGSRDRAEQQQRGGDRGDRRDRYSPGRDRDASGGGGRYPTKRSGRDVGNLDDTSPAKRVAYTDNSSLDRRGSRDALIDHRDRGGSDRGGSDRGGSDRGGDRDRDRNRDRGVDRGVDRGGERDRREGSRSGKDDRDNWDNRDRRTDYRAGSPESKRMRGDGLYAVDGGGGGSSSALPAHNVGYGMQQQQQQHQQQHHHHQGGGGGGYGVQSNVGYGAPGSAYGGANALGYGGHHAVGARGGVGSSSGGGFAPARGRERVWSGQVGIKSNQASVDMEFVGGERTLVQRLMPPQGQLIKATQRTRLNQEKLEPIFTKVQGSMSISGEACTLIARAVPGSDNEQTLVWISNYLVQKNGAGLAPMGHSNIYFFPVHEQSEKIMTLADFRSDPKNELINALLIVVTTC